MKKVIFTLVSCLIIFTLYIISFDSYGQTTVYCYPSGASQSTGRVDVYGKYDDLIRVGKGSLGQNIRGWATFDVSGIPDNATITDLELRIDVQVSSTSTNHDIDFHRLTLYPNQNSASDVRDDIDNGVCYNCSFSSEGTSIGYKYVTLDNDAISYFQNTALGWDWFGIGMIEFEGNDDDCDIYGYSNSSYKPRLKVVYTVPPPCEIIVNTPSSSDIWIEGERYEIKWTDNISDNVKIELYDGSYLEQTITSSTSSDGSYYWTVPTNAPMSENCRIKIINTSDASCYDYSSYFSIIDFYTSPIEIDVECNSGSTTFSLNTTSFTDWSINENYSWLSLNPTSGSGDKTITITYSENTSSDRSAWLPIEFGYSTTYNVHLTQSGGCQSDYLTVSPSNRDVSSGSGSTTFDISSNTSWTVSDNASWLTVSPTSGSNAGTITADYSENTSTSSRTATITVSGSGVSDKYVTVTQAGAEYTLSVTPNNQDVSSNSGSTTFDISSNTSWTVSDNASWLTVSPTSGSNAGTITADYSENTSTSSRTATITVSGSGVSDKYVTVIQAGAEYTLSVTPNNQDVSSNSGSTTFDISSNTSWTVSDNASWLTVSPTSESNAGTITADYSENTSTSSRTATITVSGSGVSDKYVTVTQEGAEYTLSVTPNNQDVSSNSGSTTFDISSNTSWTVSDNASWLTVSPTSESNAGTITADYSENTSTSSRTATITVSGSGVSDKYVTVTQEGRSTSINKPVSDNQIKIYPNPTNGKLTFECDIELDKIEIYNMLGSLIFESKFKTELDISSLNEGIYMLKLYMEKDKVVLIQKIILKKLK